MAVPQEIQRLFLALRRKIRFYLAAEGVGLWTFHLGLIFWFSLLADRFFEPSPLVRGIFSGVAIFFLLWDFWRVVLKPVMKPINDHGLAVLLEKRFPEFDDALLTLVEPERVEDSSLRDEFLTRTQSELADRLAQFRFRPLFRFKPLILGLLGAVLAAASVGGFVIGAPELFHVWTERFIAFSETPWPRLVQMELPESFSSGTLKVACGSDVQIRVRAGISQTAVESGRHLNDVLRTVYFSYKTEDGIRDRVAMERENESFTENGEWADFTYTFRGVLKSFDFDLTGGDASVRGLHVEVVDSPTAALSLRFEFPAYTALTPQTLKPGAVQAVPAGTKITVFGEANKPLTGVEVDQSRSVGENAGAERALKAQIQKSGRGFTVPLGIFENDLTLLFTLHDSDGIVSPAPIKLTLTVEEDSVPQLEVTPWGIGDCITSNARIPMKGRIKDDFGLKNVSFVWQTERPEPQTSEDPNDEKQGTKEGPKGFRRLAEWSDVQTAPPLEFELNGSLETSALDLVELGLKEKDHFQIFMAAEDRNDREPAGRRVGRSQPVTLEVVSPDQLRWNLEGREAVLGQLFDAALGEVKDSRETLGTLTFDTPENPPVQAPENTEKDSEESLQELQSYRTERVIQNNRKNSHEFYGIAESIENICLQMVNNRIDSPAWLERLNAGIREPLVSLHTKQIPELETTLTALREAIDANDLSAAKTLHAKASVQMDAILLLLAAVREKILKMQDFSEMVELMRTVVRQEEELQLEIAKQNRSALADLAGDDDDDDDDEEDVPKQEAEPVEDTGKAPTADRLVERQEEVLRTFNLWDEKIPQMLEMLRNDPVHANLLKDARQMSDEMRVRSRLEEIDRQLAEKEHSKAADGTKKLIPDLKKILAKLETEDRSQRLQSETERLRAHLKELNERIREQQSLEGRTRRARDVREIAKDQDSAAQKTGELARKISDEEQANQSENQSGENNQPSEGDQAENSESRQESKQGEKPLSESLREAQKRMDAAREKLEQTDRSGAQDEQKKALEELEQAKAELEEILRQMREEEMKRSLAQIETQLKTMIQLQRGIQDDTKRLDGIPQEKRTVEFTDEAARLSRRERELELKAETLLTMLREDGRARMMVELLTQTAQDMNRVMDFLAKGRADSVTIDLETDIIQALEEMLAAVEETERKLEEDQDSPDGNMDGSGGDMDQALIDKIAELKMIRSAEVRIWKRTQNTPASEVEILRGLSTQQEKLRKIVHEMAK